MTDANRWVSVWGNAVSVAENRPERYARMAIEIPAELSAGTLLHFAPGYDMIFR